MNDLQRLCLLQGLLANRQLSAAISLGELANGIESILNSIDVVPDGLNLAYLALWQALEIVAVQHQEAGTEPTAAELDDLNFMADGLKKEVDAEIVARGG